MSLLAVAPDVQVVRLVVYGRCCLDVPAPAQSAMTKDRAVYPQADRQRCLAAPVTQRTKNYWDGSLAKTSRPPWHERRSKWGAQNDAHARDSDTTTAAAAPCVEHDKTTTTLGSYTLPNDSRIKRFPRCWPRNPRAVSRADGRKRDESTAAERRDVITFSSRCSSCRSRAAARAPSRCSAAPLGVHRLAAPPRRPARRAATAHAAPTAAPLAHHGRA